MGKRVFITGGASGLGRSLALLHARHHDRVLIGDINAERGAEVVAEMEAAGAEGGFIHCDVRIEADLEAAAAEMDGRWGGADVVYNNAGIASAGAIDEESMESWERVIDINLMGVVRGCRVFVPRLRAAGGGTLVNVASMAGLTHPPKMASYCATKSAVVALSESLRLELAPDHIHVSAVCPSFFKTNLAESLETEDQTMRAITERLLNRPGIDADEVASRIHDGISRGEFLILPHREGRQAWWLKRLLPQRRYLKTMERQTRRFLEG